MDPSFPDLIAVRAGAGLIIGMILGSFTTMLSYRLPRGLSIVGPRSQCPHCHTDLKVADLVPIFSWLLMKGRCRHCGARISSRYILIELAVTLCVMAAFILFGFSIYLPLILAAIVAALTGLIIGIERR